MNIATQKQILRRDARRQRAACKTSSLDSDQGVAEKFFANIPLQKGWIIGGYIAAHEELDPAQLIEQLRAHGNELALPRVSQKGQPLSFHAWRENLEPVKGAYELYEASPFWPASRPDMLLVPLLAFDREGYRLGYGAGYYDRTLQYLRRDGHVVAVGLAYSGQQIAHVPRDANDQKLDWIVTEKEARRFL